MWTPLALAVVLATAVVAVWATVRAARDRPVVLRQLLAAGVVEGLLLVQVVEAAARSLRGSGPADPATFWGYLMTALLVLPGAAAWAFAERTRWSSVVLAVAALTVAFLEYRMLVVWAGG
ncbi:hypothetical protein [Actinotalea sp.]|uniref:hypothetical protein n=1 Tax=Actinotalea sp. TaxID=1872145 RepID=UPI002B6220F9|nr:hypothetical protein [Actinotalea sp.]HQY34266.1 hypothetical protein [Actinotalea sp.]HRA50530.1 hypothetical protein [Actinotalea sp.]